VVRIQQGIYFGGAMKNPDPQTHFFISMLKSGIRIFGCLLALALSSILPLGVCLITAEILGILEEIF
jgi:hypothetical protein